MQRAMVSPPLLRTEVPEKTLEELPASKGRADLGRGLTRRVGLLPKSSIRGQRASSGFALWILPRDNGRNNKVENVGVAVVKLPHRKG